jgi:phage host-nuclease inhibitor protein Gam
VAEEITLRKFPPESLSDVNAAIAVLGENLALIAREEDRAQRLITRIRERTERRIGPLKKHNGVLEDAVYTFAKRRRRKLTKERQSVELAAGSFGWRRRYNIIEITSERLALRSLRRLGFTKCIKTVESVLKSAVKRLKPKERELVSGIRSVAREYLFTPPKNVQGVERETRRPRRVAK